MARSSARRTSTTRTARLGRHSCSTRSRRRFPRSCATANGTRALKDKPRFYEGFSRSIVFVPRIAPFRSNIDHISPNERLFPTEHKADSGRFYGTLLSALDLVWFTEEDHKTKSNYADWAGSIIDELPEPEFGIHKYINDIVPGYYVKIDSSETKKYAVLYAYRPFKSADGEPEIVVLEIDENEKFVEDAPPRSIKGAQIIEVGGGNNSLCKNVVKWLKKNMGQYFNGVQVDSGTEKGQVDPAHVVEQLLGILDPEKIKSNYQEMSRKLADTFEKADEEDPFLGVRKGRMEWNRITKRSKDPKVPHETEKEQTAVYNEVTAYDKWYNKNLFRSVEIVQFSPSSPTSRVRRQSQDRPCHVGPHRAAHTARGGHPQAPLERGGLEQHEASERLSLF